MSECISIKLTDGKAPLDKLIHTDLYVQCTCCRNKHRESERLLVQDKKHKFASTLVCPRCGGHSYYDITPCVAWCWASGLIEFGTEAPEGSIPIAHGPKGDVVGIVRVRARRGKGESAGMLLLPGVPESDNQEQALKAISEWLKWCRKAKPKNGVVFTDPAELEV